MIDTLKYGITLSAVLCLAAAAPARAQDAAANIARAQQTVAEIERLLDGIYARGADAPARAASGAGTDSESLFDGQTLSGWKRTDFTGGGGMHLVTSFHGGAPAIVVDAGTALSGFNWTKGAPKTNYEITLEAMKIDGLDFMCGLTFPVGGSQASLILGGWGGHVIGISSIDDHDASENETTTSMSFVKDHWYAVRVRVTPTKLQAWLDGKKIVDADIAGKKISLRRGEISKSVPLGFATYQTSAAFRSIKLRRLEAAR